MVPRAIRLSKAVMRTIKQDLFWALLHNVILTPAAALAFVQPVLAAGVDGLQFDLRGDQ